VNGADHAAAIFTDRPRDRTITDSVLHRAQKLECRPVSSKLMMRE
jgi:hypothetical protein